MAAKVFTFQPVGLDLFDARPNHPAPGTQVVKHQPYGCPRNGTMGHAFIADAATGEFYGLVLLASLTKAATAAITVGSKVTWTPPRGRKYRTGVVDSLDTNGLDAIVKHRITERTGGSRLTYTRVPVGTLNKAA
jgi:hypothetical protein